MAKAKDSVLTIKLEQELRDAFTAEAEIADRPASQILRELMRDYIEQRQKSRRSDLQSNSDNQCYVRV